MKRITLSLITALTLAGAAQAQTVNYLIENPDNKAYFGVRAGVDISSTAGAAVDTYGNGAGFTVGAIYNIPLWKNLFFEPGVHFFYDTFSEELDGALDGDDFKVYDCSIRNCGFRIPLNFGYRFDFTDDISISVFTGPVLNTNLTAKYHMGGDEESTTSIMEKGFKRFDMQWDFGVSMNYGHNYYVAVTGGIGMTKAFSPGGLSDISSFRRNTCTISLGYNF